MAPPILIPCVDKDKEYSDASIDNILANRKTTRRSPSSNRIPSPFRDRNEVTIKNRSMLVGSTMMAVGSQSRLRISRKSSFKPPQSRDGNESPSNKFSRLEKKYEELPPSSAYGRAISSNHDCSKPRNKKFEDRIKNDDTYPYHSVANELEEIPSYSSPATTNGGKTERIFDRAQSAGSGGDLPCRNPPMKTAKIARPNMVDLSFSPIRIPTPPQTQITASKKKPLTLTGTKHITQNNTANSSLTKTGNQKNISSMAVLQCSNAVANSSTTESSPSSTSSAKVSPSKATSSEKMSAAGSVVETTQSHIQSEKDNISTSLTPKGSCKPQSPSLTATTIRKLILPGTSISENDSEKFILPEQQVEETKPKTGVNSSLNTIVKERVETPQKTETPTMSVIKSSVIQQAFPSASAVSFPGIQVKNASTGVSNVNNNMISGHSTPVTATTTKKKKTNSGNKRK